MPDDAVGRRGDGRIAGEPPGSPRRDSDSVRAPTAAERADERGRVDRVTKPCLGPRERAPGQADAPQTPPR